MVYTQTIKPNDYWGVDYAGDLRALGAINW